MQSLAEIEKEVIIARIKLMKYNLTRAARSLKISVRTLQRKLRSYGLPDSQGVPSDVRRMEIKTFIGE